MNLKAKILNLKILLGFAFIIIFYQSYINCQTSSVNYQVDMPVFDLPMDETNNFESVKHDYYYSTPEKSYNFPKSDREVEKGSTDIEFYGKSSSGIINELYESEELEDKMLVEDWMTGEFNIKSELTDDTRIIEEKMELEEWMTDPSHWKSYAKK